jgi:carbon-monoxide dehydrogenase small subunit
MARAHVTTRLNGAETDFLCEPRQSLLEVLRDELGLTGAKEGCNNGSCGACAVHLDGRLVNSCCVLAVETQGRDVNTIEGVANGQALHALQKSFLEEAALQCGICTPGFIMSAKALLESEPMPDEHRIRFWLSGNLCRCTGYDKIIKAVQRAAVELQEAK